MDQFISFISGMDHWVPSAKRRHQFWATSIA